MLEFEDLRNDSGLEFTDISSEEMRAYFKEGKQVMIIKYPVALHVSASGGHRILDGRGQCTYIKPEAWDSICWTVLEGMPHFVK